MSEDSGEKTEEASGHKLNQARQKGQVPKSMEISASVSLLAGGFFLLVMAPAGWDRVVGIYRHIHSLAAASGQELDALAISQLLSKEALTLILPLALFVLLASVAINVYQLGGFMVVGSAIAPKLDKLNMVAGLGRMFKLRTLVDCVKSVFKLFVIFLVGYLVLRDRLEEFVLMVDMAPVAIASLVLNVATEIFFKTVLLLLALAILDYGYQRWQFMQDMKMTKQEVKDEYKQIEGDPIVKNRIRQAQREASKRRQLNQVPEADVVITNPTHYAVALLYDQTQAPAPVVVAKGQDFMALRIKDIAKEAKVPIVENRPLAQALYRAVDVGQTIPAEFYKAVADVLSYIYRVKGRKKRG
ncbi:MAG: flagellar biosynthesis protein FlhB [Deltaproteobacteria bacterium]|jgi:flagellar biosynthetic protein FlhB|nr:flagellar biosynthesis protein FlhB [Deltaproteobacteria bacterium]